MDRWTLRQMEKIKKIYANCTEKNETALEAYSLYILRMLNGLAQMELSNFFYYQKKVLWNAMKIFCKYYEKQVEYVINLDQSRAVEKKKIINDIEEAVSQFSNVYKNVVDGTANSDRQMFSSLAVESNIYDLSPKLFAFYSRVLEKLVEIFKKEDTYAFLLHPTIKNNIEIVSLFDKREEHGKVVIIYIPENKIEDIKNIPIFLLHEAYHVLSNEFRHRFERTWFLNTNIILGIEQCIFQGVNLDKDSTKDKKIKEYLMERWFGDTSTIDEMKKWPWDDRRFYGQSITKILCKVWENNLKRVLDTLPKDLINAIAQFDFNAEIFSPQLYNTLIVTENTIRNSIIKMLRENTVINMLSEHLEIYQESYADLACLLTLKPSILLYKNVFRDTIPFKITDEEYSDNKRELRMLSVARIVQNCNFSDKEKWAEYVSEQERKLLKPSRSYESDSQGSTSDTLKGAFGRMDLECYQNYLQICADDLYKFLELNPQLIKFRKVLNDVTLQDILSGEVEQKIADIY